MLRSTIINNAALLAAARRSLAPSSAANKASLSTLSFHLSSVDDTCEDSSNHTYKQVAFTNNNDSVTTNNNMKSSICNYLVAILSGDATALVSLHQTQSQIIEEENNWGGVMSSTDLVVRKEEEEDEESPLSLSVWLISTLKRRKKMMNKHKLRKRRKKLRLKTRRG
mmetsp:Transcript_28082/g.44182  ORF Transcript_28082/g.44182 Transcript_28082/m.44182 type:complete len:167 (+) Transcript_28082:165-665(+)